MATRPGAALCACVVLLCAGSAAADGGNPGRAKDLFEEARKLDEKGDYDHACPLFKQAVALEPNAVGGIFHLARCYERSGKLASAVEEYSQAERAATVAGQDDRAKYARAQIDAITPKLAQLTIRVADDARRPGLAISRDEQAVPESLWGSPQPVDAGVHQIRASQQGSTLWSGSVTARDGHEASIEVPAPDGGGLRVPIWAWASGGAGVLFGAIAIGFAVDQANAQKSVHSHCPDLSSGALCDTSDGFSPSATNSRLDRDFGLALGFGIAGIGALGAGVVGAVLASREPARQAVRVAPWVAARSSGVLVTIGIQ